MTGEEFIQQVERSQREFRRFLTALCCGNSVLADDIAQESYLKAYLSLGSFCDDSKFKSWLFRIGYNCFLNSRRTSRPSADFKDLENEPSDLESDNGFIYQDLYMALEKLPSKERTALLLFYMEGYSVKETAGIISAGEDAVRQYLSRGRKHMKVLIDKTR